LKRFVCLLLAFIMLSLFSAGAVIIDDTNAYWANGVHTDGINNDAYDQALMLKKLGLFKGIKPSTGEDGEMTRAEMFECFDLERRMTRLEAAVMYVRFLGAEEKVLSGTWSHPFTDVPEWANPYIGWLFRSGLIKGVSKTRYGSDQPSTFRQYAKFLSLAVCGNENYEVGGVATAEEVNLWDGINGYFSRAAAVGLATRALSLTYTKNGNWTYSMAQFLIHHGVFDSTRLLDAAWGVLPPDYITGDGGVLVLRMAGVSV